MRKKSVIEPNQCEPNVRKFDTKITFFGFFSTLLSSYGCSFHHFCLFCFFFIFFKPTVIYQKRPPTQPFLLCANKMTVANLKVILLFKAIAFVFTVRNRLMLTSMLFFSPHMNAVFCILTAATFTADGKQRGWNKNPVGVVERKIFVK